MKHRVKYILLIIVAVCAAHISAPVSRAAELDEENQTPDGVTRLLVESYLAKKDIPKAVEKCRELVASDPSDVKARTLLADMLSWIKEYDESISEYREALRRAPGDRDTELKLAGVYVWKGDLAGAEAAYRDILSKRPGDTEASALLGQVLTWEKKYAEAQALFEGIIAKDTTTKTRLMYAQAFLYSGDHARAEEMLNGILKEKPDDFDAMVSLADTYAYSKRFARGEELYRKALEIRKDPAVTRKLADTLSWDRQYKDAVALYDAVLAEKDDPEARRQKARILGWARDHRASLREYGKIAPVEAKYKLEMDAKKEYWSNRVKAAIRDYRELISAEPDNVEAMFDLSQLCSYQGMWSEAIDEYDRILGVYKTHFRAKEGREKAVLISQRPCARSGYEFLEADSTSRDMDINMHRFFQEFAVPVGPKAKVEGTYRLAGRSFSDYPDIVENEGRFKFAYTEAPDWAFGGYYGFVGYNRGSDEIVNLFGGNAAARVLDMATASFNYDRERLVNSSQVIRRNLTSDSFKERILVDATTRLKLGADYLYSSYSDGNFKNEPGADMLYYFTLEPKAFYVKYRYFYREFHKKVPEYFSPKGFTTNALTVGWKHFLNKEEIFFGANDLYYVLDYEPALDSEYIVSHKFSWELCWDVTKRFNLSVKGNVTGSSANVYRDSGVQVAAKYYF